MSLTTVTLALDDKLRSLRNSSFESDKEYDNDDQVFVNKQQPLTLGENIPFADESPERPLIPTKSKPVRVQSYSIPNTRYNTRLCSSSSLSTNTSNSSNPDLTTIGSLLSPLTTITTILSATSITPTLTTTTSSAAPSTNYTNNNSNKDNINNKENSRPLSSQLTPQQQLPSTQVAASPLPPLQQSSQSIKILSTSSDDTDASTTSSNNPTFHQTTSAVGSPAIVHLDRDVIREMNRILATLERKATKLNRSLSLNYKNHKSGSAISGNCIECCCNNHSTYLQHRSSSRNGISSNCGSGNGGSSGGNGIGNNDPRYSSLTKDEKTDKNINKKRQIHQDNKNRRYANRSIKRRHTVGGTHDYGSKVNGTSVSIGSGNGGSGGVGNGHGDINGTIGNHLNGRCYQGHHNNHNMVTTSLIRTSSPDLGNEDQDQQLSQQKQIISNEN